MEIGETIKEVKQVDDLLLLQPNKGSGVVNLKKK